MAFTPLSKLVPPSAFLTKVMETREDLRKIREYLRELTDWAASQFTSIQSTLGSTIVNSFNSRTGAVVPTSGDYTATLVGLGNVTNDSQLKRSANDFNTFTHKTAPAAADVLILEDSAAVGVKKYATITEVVGSTAASQSPYTIRTSAASAVDDEFYGGSADLATRGWTVRNMTAGVAMTRVGDVDPWAASTLTTSQYRSTIQGTYLLLQIPTNNNRVFVYRALTPSTAGHVFARCEITAGISVSNNFCAARAWIDNAGIPNNGAGTTLSAFAMIQNDTNNMDERFGRGDTTDVTVTSGDNLTSRDGRGFFYSATNQYRYFASGVGGIHLAVPLAAAVTGPTISALAWIGFDLLNTDNTSPTKNLNGMFTIDYIRHYTGTGWVL